MACTGCGGNIVSNVKFSYETFSLADDALNGDVKIGAKAAIKLTHIGGDIQLRAGNVMRVNRLAADTLVQQGAPIWILS